MIYYATKMNYIALVRRDTWLSSIHWYLLLRANNTHLCLTWNLLIFMAKNNRNYLQCLPVECTDKLTVPRANSWKIKCIPHLYVSWICNHWTELISYIANPIMQLVFNWTWRIIIYWSCVFLGDLVRTMCLFNLS